MFQPYDSWSYMHKKWFNPEGTWKTEEKQKLLAKGKPIETLDSWEAQKKEEVRQWQEREQYWQTQFGSSFAEWEAASRGKATSQVRQHQQLESLRNGEELSELPYGIEQDDYYAFYERG